MSLTLKTLRTVFVCQGDVRIATIEHKRKMILTDVVPKYDVNSELAPLLAM